MIEYGTFWTVFVGWDGQRDEKHSFWITTLMTVRVSLFNFFKQTVKEQWNKPKYSSQSRREPQMLTLRKCWEAAQSCLADEICLFGLRQAEQKEMQQLGELGDVRGWQQTFPYGREGGTAAWRRSMGTQKEGKVGAFWETHTKLAKCKVASGPDKQATSFLHVGINHLSALLSICTPLTPSTWPCWSLRMGIKLNVRETKAVQSL